MMQLKIVYMRYLFLGLSIYLVTFSAFAQFEGPQAQPGGFVLRPGDVPDQFYSGFQFGKGAQSTYSGGGNFDQVQGSAVGPYNLGDRAEYGTLAFMLNQEFFYDSNVFLDNSDAIAGEGSVTTPGFYYKLGTGEENIFQVGLDVNLVNFSIRLPTPPGANITCPN